MPLTISRNDIWWRRLETFRQLQLLIPFNNSAEKWYILTFCQLKEAFLGNRVDSSLILSLVYILFICCLCDVDKGAIWPLNIRIATYLSFDQVKRWCLRPNHKGFEEWRCPWEESKESTPSLISYRAMVWKLNHHLLLSSM